MQYDGLILPLSCIRTAQGLGVGSFLDLIPLLNLMKKIRFNLLQLLPLNDTGYDPSPYNAISNLAFHPIYISLDNSLIQDDEKEKFQQLNLKKRIQFSEVLDLKLSILDRMYHSLSELEIEKIKEFAFKFPDLKIYSIYQKFKELHRNSPISSWPTKYLDKEFQNAFFESNIKDCLFFIYLQKLCHEQLELVSRHAKNLGIKLMCDLPILVSPESVEVFEYPEFFNFDYVAGAPPDEFNKEGQYWGFPTYNWQEVMKSDYSLWKNRFSIMDQFFSHFRIDHILGFFRFFSIPKGSHPKNGHYRPHHEHEAKTQGFQHLKSILKYTHMTPVGEDLGTKFKGIDEVLTQLKIVQTKIIRWEKKKQKFIPLDHYPKNSIVSLSNHDISLFLSWWHHHTESHEDFLKLFDVKFDSHPEAFQFDVLKKFHQIRCDYRVNLIQEYLMIDEKLHSKEYEEDRINIPGEINSKNWTYFIPVTLENLSDNRSWIDKILTLTDNKL